MDYNREHGTEVRIVRIFNTYGPRMALDDGRVVSNFVSQALTGVWAPCLAVEEITVGTTVTAATTAVAALLTVLGKLAVVGPVTWRYGCHLTWCLVGLDAKKSPEFISEGEGGVNSTCLSQQQHQLSKQPASTRSCIVFQHLLPCCRCPVVRQASR